MKIGLMERKILEFIGNNEKSKRDLIKFQMRIYQDNFYSKYEWLDKPKSNIYDNFAGASLCASSCIKRIYRMVEKDLIRLVGEDRFEAN